MLITHSLDENRNRLFQRLWQFLCQRPWRINSVDEIQNLCYYSYIILSYYILPLYYILVGLTISGSIQSKLRPSLHDWEISSNWIMASKMSLYRRSKILPDSKEPLEDLALKIHTLHNISMLLYKEKEGEDRHRQVQYTSYIHTSDLSSKCLCKALK